MRMQECDWIASGYPTGLSGLSIHDNPKHRNCQDNLYRRDIYYCLDIVKCSDWWYYQHEST